MMSDKSDQRALAIESLQRRTERGLTELGQAIGGYRGVAEAMDAQLLRQDARIEHLKAVNADLLAACDEAVAALMLLPPDCLDDVAGQPSRDELINNIFSAIARARPE